MLSLDYILSTLNTHSFYFFFLLLLLLTYQTPNVPLNYAQDRAFVRADIIYQCFSLISTHTIEVCELPLHDKKGLAKKNALLVCKQEHFHTTAVEFCG